MAEQLYTVDDFRKRFSSHLANLDIPESKDPSWLNNPIDPNNNSRAQRFFYGLRDALEKESYRSKVGVAEERVDEEATEVVKYLRQIGFTLQDVVMETQPGVFVPYRTKARDWQTAVKAAVERRLIDYTKILDEKAQTLEREYQEKRAELEKREREFNEREESTKALETELKSKVITLRQREDDLQAREELLETGDMTSTEATQYRALMTFLTTASQRDVEKFISEQKEKRKKPSITKK